MKEREPIKTFQQEREHDSLYNVRTALKQVHRVIKVTGTPTNGYEDTKLKYDLVAELRGDTVSWVGIQVKSSEEFMAKFLKQINPDYPNNMQSVLCKMNLVVLNGQQPTDTIANNFRRQISAMKKFYRNNK